MAVPKRKMSRSNTRSRRAKWKAEAPALVNVRINGEEVRMPRHLVPAAKRGLVNLHD